MKKILIPYFPLGIKISSLLLVGMAGYLVTINNYAWAVILILLTVIIFTTNYVTEINISEKVCRDYLSFLTIPFQEDVIKFSKIDKLIITKANHSQMLNTRSRSRQLDWASFTGSLVLDDNQKSLDLLTRNDRTELIKGLKEFSSFLQVDIEDHTTSSFFVIDTTKF